MATTPKVTMSNVKSSAQMILTVYLGLAMGVFTLSKIPGMYAKYVTAAVGLIGPFAFKNPTVKLLMAVIGAAGVAKIVKDLTAGKTGALSLVNSYAPTLSGVRGLGNNANYYLGNVDSSFDQLSLGNPEAPASSASQMLSMAN